MRTLVLVEPEIPENTGFIARLAANFYFELRIVNPDFNLADARKTAKNAQKKLRNAEIYDTVENAVEDLDFVVGTKPGRGTVMHEFTPRENTSLMIGRESSGLSNAELELCDTVVHIQTSENASINQSHAASILMSHFNRSESKGMTKGQSEKLNDILEGNELEKVVKSANPDDNSTGRIIGELKSNWRNG